MPIKTISAQQAKDLSAKGTVLVDIRPADEHCREKISGAVNVPMDELSLSKIPKAIVVFHCRSGMRTKTSAEKLGNALAGQECYILEGGLEAWKSSGGPVQTDKSQPLELIRQVQLAAGSLVLIGVILSLSVSSAFIAISAFVGCGLMFAGATGWCGLAKFLGVMPWNK